MILKIPPNQSKGRSIHSGHAQNHFETNVVGFSTRRHHFHTNTTLVAGNGWFPWRQKGAGVSPSRDAESVRHVPVTTRRATVSVLKTTNQRHGSHGARQTSRGLRVKNVTGTATFFDADSIFFPCWACIIAFAVGYNFFAVNCKKVAVNCECPVAFQYEFSQ